MTNLKTYDILVTSINKGEEMTKKQKQQLVELYNKFIDAGEEMSIDEDVYYSVAPSFVAFLDEDEDIILVSKGV